MLDRGLRSRGRREVLGLPLESFPPRSRRSASGRFAAPRRDGRSPTLSAGIAGKLGPSDKPLARIFAGHSIFCRNPR